MPLQEGMGLGGLTLQLDIPIGDVEEVSPAFIVFESNTDLSHGAPFGSFRFSHQLHSGFAGGTVGLMCVTADAGADDVFPGGGAAAISWNDVVEV